MTNSSETVSTSHSKADCRRLNLTVLIYVYTVDKILQKRISGAAALWINEKKNLTEILKFILDLESWDSYFTIDIKWRLLTKKCLSYKGLSIQQPLISLCCTCTANILFIEIIHLRPDYNYVQYLTVLTSNYNLKIVIGYTCNKAGWETGTAWPPTSDHCRIYNASKQDE